MNCLVVISATKWAPKAQPQGLLTMGSIQLRDMNRDDRLAAINAQIKSHPGLEDKIIMIGAIGVWEKGEDEILDLVRIETAEEAGVTVASLHFRVRLVNGSEVDFPVHVTGDFRAPIVVKNYSQGIAEAAAFYQTLRN